MAVFIRSKRVTDPLDDRVKARLRGDDHRMITGYVSSGSEHEASELSSLIHGFFLDDDDEDNTDADLAGEKSDGSDCGGDHRPDKTSPGSPAALIRELLNPVEEDGFRRDLVTDVAEAVQRLAGIIPSQSVFRREVMGSLRVTGYNAGLCKAKWRSSGNVTAGSYEYIDVVRSSLAAAAEEEKERYIVDVEFAGEFEIARPTAEYGRVVAALPRVFVGKAEELKQVVRIVAKEAKRALRSRDLHVPPWRKARYMRAKWLGPYRRTVNAVPASSAGPDREVEFRSVGFDPARSSLTRCGDSGMSSDVIGFCTRRIPPIIVKAGAQ